LSRGEVKVQGAIGWNEGGGYIVIEGTWMFDPALWKHVWYGIHKYSVLSNVSMIMVNHSNLPTSAVEGRWCIGWTFSLAMRRTTFDSRHHVARSLLASQCPRRRLSLTCDDRQPRSSMMGPLLSPFSLPWSQSLYLTWNICTQQNSQHYTSCSICTQLKSCKVVVKVWHVKFHVASRLCYCDRTTSRRGSSTRISLSDSRWSNTWVQYQNTLKFKYKLVQIRFTF
jgi:hypothetical protein